MALHAQTLHAIDREALLERLGDDIDLVEELVGLFEEEGPRLLAMVREALGNNDAQGVERSAHSLKGMLTPLAATSTAADALRLELLGRSGELHGAEAIVAQLEQGVPEVQDALHAVVRERDA